MAHPNKVRGDAFERAVREHCRAAGFDADRTRAGYARDHGDIHLAATPAGPRLILQAKNVRQVDLAGFMRETEEQRREAKAEHGAVVIKRRGVADPGQSYVVQTLDEYLEMARRAGYAIETGFEITCIECGQEIHGEAAWGETEDGPVHLACADNDEDES